MIGLLLIGVFALLFVTAALAPLESLSWFAWNKQADQSKSPMINTATGKKNNQADAYLIYFSGIGAISGTSIPQEEYPFLAGLAEQLPEVKVITDIYPYSVTNNGLTGQRQFTKLWRWVEKLRLKNPDSAMSLIVNIRNLFQMFVSADRRYGPIYNLGIGEEIVRVLERHGYDFSQQKPVVLIGWSGGGQIAIGAANYLQLLKTHLYVISLGGLLSDDTGLSNIYHLWHLYGTHDNLQALGQKLFAGRWPMFSQSPWNVALKQQKITLVELGPYHHNGKGNYFDMETHLLTEMQTFGGHTISTIKKIILSAILTQ